MNQHAVGAPQKAWRGMRGPAGHRLVAVTLLVAVAVALSLTQSRLMPIAVGGGSVCAPGGSDDTTLIAIDMIENHSDSDAHLVDVRLDQPRGLSVVGADLITIDEGPGTIGSVGGTPRAGLGAGTVQAGRVGIVELSLSTSEPMGRAYGAILTLRDTRGRISTTHTCMELAVAAGESCSGSTGDMTPVEEQEERAGNDYMASHCGRSRAVR
ncbi:hypothetical protein [Tessaracoccus sp.]